MIRRLYLKYLRYRIKKSKSIDELVDVFRNISFFYPSLSGDDILNIISECFIAQPPNDQELQRFSTFQQQHEYTLGIESYVSFIIWISTIDTVNKKIRCTSTRDCCF